MLKDLLEKKAKGEELTEQELALIAEYEEQLGKISSNFTSKIEELQGKVNEKEEIEKKLAELQELNTSKLQELDSLKVEKEELEKKIQESGNIEEIKSAVRKAMETKQQLELERERNKQKELIKQKENEATERIKALEEKLSSYEKLRKESDLKQELVEEKMKRPYLIKQLDKLITEIEVKGVDQTRMILNFILEGINHEEELDKYTKAQSAGTSILSVLPPNVKSGKEEPKDEFEQFLKRSRVR